MASDALTLRRVDLTEARNTAVISLRIVSVLVLSHFEIIGYSMYSLMRASSVVNCQWAWRVAGSLRGSMPGPF